MLLVTGLVLVWDYRPLEQVTAWQLVHRWASVLLLPTTWVLVAAGVGLARARGRPLWFWAAPALLAVLAVGAAFSGYLLPWDQAVLPDVVVAPDLRGMGVAFDDRVSGVILDDVIVSRTAFQRWVVAHLGVGALVCLVPVGFTWWARRPKLAP